MHTFNQFRYSDGYSHVGTVPTTYVHRHCFPKGKQRELGRDDLALPHAQENVAWQNASLKRSSTRVHILKRPAIAAVVPHFEKSGANCHLPRCARPAFVVEAGVTDPELPDQVVEFALELRFVSRGENAFPACLGNSTPIHTIQFRIVKLLLTRFDNLVEDRAGLVLR
jgi:hypothetical protein